MVHDRSFVAVLFRPSGTGASRGERGECASLRYGDEAGYSLAEVMASIMLLTIAIIPMVSMLDAGLNAASRSGNYDKARALANQQLEEAKSLPYDVVRDEFPNGTSASQPAPDGFGYTVAKRFVDRNLAETDEDEGLMKVTVTVRWGDDNSYSITGIVGR